MVAQNPAELKKYLKGVVSLEGGQVKVLDEAALQGSVVDRLVLDAVFAAGETQAVARYVLWELGQVLGIRPASINDLYLARGRGEAGQGWTVPAMNLRVLAYDMARAVFRAALARGVGAMIFEIARSEIGYTAQRPAEYATVLIGAAIREGFRGPLFIQGDHFQVSASKYTSAREAELQAVEDLIREAIAAGFFNIDIDTSTLVDLSYPTVPEQQRINFELCARYTEIIRSLEPAGVTVSVGGEIGEVGKKNSTAEEVRAFMDGYYASLPQGVTGLSKLSIQTGTSHGGVVLPDGSLAQVKIDFDTLQRLGCVAREEYGMGGVVQHGASTLPPEAFHTFAQVDACEVHLATGFQNIVYDHDLFPDSLRQAMYTHIKEAHAGQWKEGQTEEQFIYKERKRALGPFKEQMWGLPDDVRVQIGQSLEEQFGFLFDQLNVGGTADVVAAHVKPVELHKTPSDFGLAGDLEISDDLAD
ncbi:MAG: class II fructose-bisphosphate aldolase [Anaerolineae bacterium]|nr:class II fructose-bisphosphate aldolase [Anaerolineae bacterium]